MIKHMSISETQEKLTSLEDEFSNEDTISVTDQGKNRFAILRWDTYEAITETLEILSDEAAYSDVKKGLRQLQNDEVVDLEALKKEFHV